MTLKTSNNTLIQACVAIDFFLYLRRIVHNKSLQKNYGSLYHSKDRMESELNSAWIKRKNLSSSCSGSTTFTHFFLKTFIHYRLRDLRYMTFRFLLCCKDFQDSLYNLLRSRICPLIHVNLLHSSYNPLFVRSLF